MTKLETTSNALQTKANYSICAELKQQIPANAEVAIELPEQFALRGKLTQYAPIEVISGEHDGITYPSTPLTVELNRY